MKRHAEQPSHIANVCSLLQIDFTDDLIPVGSAPTHEMFLKVWDAICKGHSPSMPMVGIGHGRKVSQLAWCIYQSMLRLDIKFMKSGSGLESLGIARDESKNKLDIRFSATVVHSGLIQNRKGFMGRVQAYSGSAALDIVQGTKQVFKRFATPNMDPPGCRRDNSRYDRAFHDLMRDKLRHLSVGSASNELLAGRMMRSGEKLDNLRAFAPSLYDVTRDKTHGVRRTRSCCCMTTPPCVFVF